MPMYTVKWTWTLDRECGVRSTAGDPLVLFPNWGSNTPWLEIAIAEPFGCGDWATVSVRQIESPGTGSIVSRPLKRISRGQTSNCNPAVPHAQCTQIRSEADAGIYRFEVNVSRGGGQSVRSEVGLDYRR